MDLLKTITAMILTTAMLSANSLTGRLVLAAEQPAALWQSVAFGESTSEATNSIHVIDHDTVNIQSTDNSGKLLISGSDGIAFYYTAIPKTSNFVLSATVTVNEWLYSNAQEGFALLAKDIVPTENLYNHAYYANSYGILGSKVEYTWNSDTNELTTGSGIHYTMRLGLGARWINGITGDPLQAPEAGQVTNEFVPLETSAAQQGLEPGNYNIIGNSTSANVPATIAELTTFEVMMKKTNTGFEVYYTDQNGVTTRDILYDWESLFTVDPDYVYVGFAAARNMDITVDNIDLTFSDPATDPPAQDRPIRTIEPVYQILSGSTSGTQAHDIYFKANATGILNVKDRLTNQILSGAEAVQITANQEQVVPVTLDVGANQFTLEFTPDPHYKPGEYMQMSNYDAAHIKHDVQHQAYLYQTVYATPTGTSTGDGSIQAPLNLRTALQFASPGTTIVLAPGQYDLNRAIAIPKGVNGKQGEPITLVAEPSEDGLRPILNFNRQSAGLVHMADYWVFRGFDITNTRDMEKGIQISGHHNWFEDIQTYRNGNTGLQISGLASDNPEKWPSYNTIKSCTSFENADIGFEDADGFAAKLTVGAGNIFDGCIAYHNADDGWDLFAKNETGSIGVVTIKNSVSFRNGWLPDNDEQTGNGNGFKLGGSSLPGAHQLINCLSFENLAKGIDSNSGTNIVIQNSSSFNNQSYNIALYTSSATQTDFLAQGILSYRTKFLPITEQIKLLNQDAQSVYQNSNYYWDGQQAVNASAQTIQETWFESLVPQDSGVRHQQPIDRYENGSIHVHGLMQLDQEHQHLAGAILNESTSPFSPYPQYTLAEGHTDSQDPTSPDPKTPEPSAPPTAETSTTAAELSEEQTNSSVVSSPQTSDPIHPSMVMALCSVSICLILFLLRKHSLGKDGNKNSPV